MAISWGTWEYSGGNGMRVGVETTISTVTTSSTTVTFTFKVYTENQYNYSSDGQVLTYGGTCGSGTTSYTNNGATGNVTLRSTETCVYTYSTYGTSPGTRTFTATLSGAYNGVTPTKSVTVTIPARPYAAPNAPSAVTATRNSDVQATVAWTNNTTAQKPYTSKTLQMRTYTGGTWSGWSTIASPTATSTSQVVTGLSANHIYDFQIRSNNTIGSSAFVAAAAYVRMTPGDPTSVTAGITGGGATILVSWTDTAYDDVTNTFSIERSVAGGAYASVITGIAYNVTSWTDPTPGVGTNQYRVKVVQSIGSLSSGWATSNSVSTVVAPLAPTLLVPNGSAADVANDGVVLTWQHNQGGDGAAQGAYQVQFSSNGGATWVALDTGTVSAVPSTHTVAPGVLANGVVYQWRVRTRGITSGGFGPYSSAATLTATSQPTATLVAGHPAATTTALPLDIQWVYNQSEGSVQAAWRAQLINDTVTVLYETVEGTGTGTSATFTYPVQDGVTYWVQVQVQSALGVWSDQAFTLTTIDLLPPAAITLTGEYQECTGVVVLNLVPQADVPGTTVPVDAATIERRIPDGEWVTIAENITTLPTDILDTTPRTHGSNEYRVTSISNSPSYFLNPVVTIMGTDGWFDDGTKSDGMWGFLSWGDAFENVLRMRGGLATSATSMRNREAQQLLGRRLPLAMIGQAAGRTFSIAGTIRFLNPCAPIGPDDCTYDNHRDDWEEASWESEIVCWRDYTGRRVFGIMGDLSTGDGPRPGMADVSFTVTQTDYVELPGTVTE